MCLLQRYQHIYLGALYGLLVVKAVLVDDFKALADGAIGPLQLARMTDAEVAVFWGCKALYIAYFIALPALRSPHSLWALMALWLISEMVAGWMFAFLFQVSRVHPPAQIPRQQPAQTCYACFLVYLLSGGESTMSSVESPASCASTEMAHECDRSIVPPPPV